MAHGKPFRFDTVRPADKPSASRFHERTVKGGRRAPERPTVMTVKTVTRAARPLPLLQMPFRPV